MRDRNLKRKGQGSKKKGKRKTLFFLPPEKKVSEKC